MSAKCAEYHCPHPRACPCYGWCAGHRAAFATWECEHLKPPPVIVKPAPKPEPVKQAEPEPEPEPPAPLVSILRPAYALPDVYEDDPDDQNDQPSPSPPRTPEPASETLTIDPVAELARVHSEHMAQITAEMESMKKKLREYEEQKAIIENIQQLEAKCATLAVQPATQQMPQVQKNAAPGQPIRQARPLPKVALPALNAGSLKPTGQKKK